MSPEWVSAGWTNNLCGCSSCSSSWCQALASDQCQDQSIVCATNNSIGARPVDRLNGVARVNWPRPLVVRTLSPVFVVVLIVLEPLEPAARLTCNRNLMARASLSIRITALSCWPASRQSKVSDSIKFGARPGAPAARRRPRATNSRPTQRAEPKQH